MINDVKAELIRYRRTEGKGEQTLRKERTYHPNATASEVHGLGICDYQGEREGTMEGGVGKGPSEERRGRIYQGEVRRVGLGPSS